MVQAWVDAPGGRRRARPSTFIAMDNEPELWGYNHYDVHPACTDVRGGTRQVPRPMPTPSARSAPDVELLGPVACCWYDYWDTAPGPADDDEADYLTWFLDQVRRHDDGPGTRSLDVLDVHYYPQSDVYNDDDRCRDGRPAAAQHPLAVGPDVRRRVVDRPADPLHPPDAATTIEARVSRTRGWPSASGTSAPTPR